MSFVTEYNWLARDDWDSCVILFAVAIALWFYLDGGITLLFPLYNTLNRWIPVDGTITLLFSVDSKITLWFSLHTTITLCFFLLMVR